MLFLERDVRRQRVRDLVEERRALRLSRVEELREHPFHAAVVVHEEGDGIGHAGNRTAGHVPRRVLACRAALRTSHAASPPVNEAIGWLSSVILLITIGQQVFKQWRDHTSKGVSRWLFVGQMLASCGFTLYSWLVHNWIFVVTNGVLLCAAIAGFFIDRRNRAQASSASAASAS